MVAERLRLGDHAAHREQDVIDAVGVIEIAAAGLADDIVQRRFEQEAEQLDDQRRGGQDGRTLQKVLFLHGFVFHWGCSSGSSAKTFGIA